ncbi:hypothetical protein ACSBL2_23090 [Pedobacter sp. AW31-3R]|uniref:hypothetical protein n=1 Tax=Pedobacter sp. AW31-3R TaxID=3445781 RepID=UPI003F9FF479
METTNPLIRKGSFTDKVMIGLKIALRKLAEDAAAKDENLIIGDKFGKAKSVPAKEILEMLKKQEG